MERTVGKVWLKLQESKSRMKHLRRLEDEGLGTNIDEFFLRKTNKLRKSEVWPG